MKTSKTLLKQTVLAVACVGLATPTFTHYQVKADELFGTVAVQEEVNGLGGASLIDKETGVVYQIDPDTGQLYTLEKLLELGTISEEEYQVYAEARQAALVIAEVDQNEAMEIVQIVQVVQEEVVDNISGQSTDARNSGLKVLPKTSDATSILEVVSGCLLLGIAGLGLKNSKK